MLLVTTESVPGHKITKVLGVVIGYGYPGGWTAGIEKRNEESWDRARHSISSQARALEANAVVAMRMEWYSAVSIVYGTAVIVEQDAPI